MEHKEEVLAVEAVTGEERKAIAEAGILGRIIDRVGLAFALCFLISMSILILEIFMRYVLNSPTLWAHETTIFLCAIAFIYGGVYCAAHDRHIRVVLLYDMVGPKMRRVLDVIISLVCFFSAAFFAYASWLMVARSVWSPDGAIRLERTAAPGTRPILHF